VKSTSTSKTTPLVTISNLPVVIGNLPLLVAMRWMIAMATMMMRWTVTMRWTIMMLLSVVNPVSIIVRTYVPLPALLRTQTSYGRRYPDRGRTGLNWWAYKAKP